MEKRVYLAVQNAALSFNESLKVYWCAYRGKDKAAAPKDNDVSERNVSFHFCSALQKQKFKIYAEVGHNRGSGIIGRLDYLAIDSEKDAMLSIEAKRIHDSGSIKSILQDVDRVREFKIQLNSDYFTGKPIKNRYGVIIGITWSCEVKKKWNALLKPSQNQKSKYWSSLSKKMIELDSKIGAVSIGGADVPGYEQGWVLYAVFNVA